MSTCPGPAAGVVPVWWDGSRRFEVGELESRSADEVWELLMAATHGAIDARWLEGWRRRIMEEAPKLVWALACEAVERPKRAPAAWINAMYLRGVRG